MATIICDYCEKKVKDNWIPTEWGIVEGLWWNRVACDQCKTKT